MIGEFATNVIMAYGGGNWVHQIFQYGSGLNDAGIARFKNGKGTICSADSVCMHHG